MKEYDTMLDATNPAARLPVVVAVDCSESMTGEPIEELNRGLKRFFEEVRADDAAMLSAEIALVTFRTEAEVAHGFAPAYGYPEAIPELSAEGTTATGAALELAERLLEEREALYRQEGIPFYKPWCLLLTDGKPFPNEGWQEPARRFRERAAQGKLTYLCVGVGNDIDEETLRELSAEEPGVVRLQDLRFGAFFRWVSASLHDVSVAGAAGGGDVRLRGIAGWARAAGVSP